MGSLIKENGICFHPFLLSFSMTSLPAWQDERGKALDPARGEEGRAGAVVFS
jgi:hypothetical protein